LINSAEENKPVEENKPASDAEAQKESTS
jgi:hypothetical protein